MLSHHDNATLTRVAAGTPMGTLLRRYWMPICSIAESEECGVKPVRLLGEDLVLFRDRSGRFGLVARQCPHRGADLANGMLEDCGIRCTYHGWLFDQSGACRAQPFEESMNAEAGFCSKSRIAAYPVQANAGLLWAYLGPAPAPVVPNWRNFHRKGYKHLCFVHLHCNWLQIMENAFDQVHNEWMHDKWSYYLRDGSVPVTRWRTRGIIHREFDEGWTAEVEYESGERLPDRTILCPNYSCLGDAFEWVVPVDDTHTLLIYQHVSRFYTSAPFTQERIPYWYGETIDRSTGRPLTHPPRNQDFVAWEGQGPIVDRTAEHLGSSDTGVIAFRRALFRQITVAAEGGDPKGVVRDPSRYLVMLPESVPSGPERDGLPGALRKPSDVKTLGYVAGFPQRLADELDRINRERGEGAEFARVLKNAGWKVGGRDFKRQRHFSPLRTHGLAQDDDASAGRD